MIDFFQNLSWMEKIFNYSNDMISYDRPIFLEKKKGGNSSGHGVLSRSNWKVASFISKSLISDVRIALSSCVISGSNKLKSIFSSKEHSRFEINLLIKSSLVNCLIEFE